MSDPNIIVRGFSLTAREIAVIDRVSKERLLFNQSAALRQIICEWSEKQDDSGSRIQDNERAPVSD